MPSPPGSAEEGMPVELENDATLLKKYLDNGWVVPTNSVAFATFASSFPNPERAAELLATLAVDVALNAHPDLPALALELQKEFAGLLGDPSPEAFAQGELLGNSNPAGATSDDARQANPLDERAFMTRLCYHALSFEAEAVKKAAVPEDVLPENHAEALRQYRGAYDKLNLPAKNASSQSLINELEALRKVVSR